jgi:tetratricopeptide (TPR) repeat protein
LDRIHLELTRKVTTLILFPHSHASCDIILIFMAVHQDGESSIVNHQKQKSRANRLCPLPPSLRQEAYFPNLLTPASPNRQSFRIITRHVCCKLFLREYLRESPMEKSTDLIRVRYRNGQEGLVDDVTLNELLLYKKISHFYRSSENQWVQIANATLRLEEKAYWGPERRRPIYGVESESRNVRRGLLTKLYKRPTASISKLTTSQEWFENGFCLMIASGKYAEAIRAFAIAIRLDASHVRAFRNRGTAYQILGNLQQALDDFSRVIEMQPGDPKAYYLRGVLYWNQSRVTEALADLKTAAELGYQLARVFLKEHDLGGGDVA